VKLRRNSSLRRFRISPSEGEGEGEGRKKEIFKNFHRINFGISVGIRLKALK
jgi:hypothetical protein